MARSIAKLNRIFGQDFMVLSVRWFSQNKSSENAIKGYKMMDKEGRRNFIRYLFFQSLRGYNDCKDMFLEISKLL